MTNTQSSKAIRKLVIVDDEQAFTTLLGEVLSETLTCPVVTFTSSAQAMEFIKREPIGMLVTDFYMPTISGIDLARELDQSQPGVPAIILTGHRIDGELAQVSSMPAVRTVIQKPFGLKQLAASIVKHWESQPVAAIRG